MEEVDLDDDVGWQIQATVGRIADSGFQERGDEPVKNEEVAKERGVPKKQKQDGERDRGKGDREKGEEKRKERYR